MSYVISFFLFFFIHKKNYYFLNCYYLFKVRCCGWSCFLFAQYFIFIFAPLVDLSVPFHLHSKISSMIKINLNVSYSYKIIFFFNLIIAQIFPTFPFNIRQVNVGDKKYVKK